VIANAEATLFAQRRIPFAVDHAFPESQTNRAAGAERAASPRRETFCAVDARPFDRAC